MASSPASSDAAKAEQYIENYKMLDIRTTVLQEEHMAAMDQHQDAKAKLTSKKGTLATLKNEREDCLTRLRKVQKEL